MPGLLPYLLLDLSDPHQREESNLNGLGSDKTILRRTQAILGHGYGLSTGCRYGRVKQAQSQSPWLCLTEHPVLGKICYKKNKQHYQRD